MIDQKKFELVKRFYKDSYYEEGNDFRKQIEYIESHPDSLCSEFDNKFLDECISHYNRDIKSFFVNGSGLLGLSALLGCLSLDHPIMGVFSLFLGALGVGNIYRGLECYLDSF